MKRTHFSNMLCICLLVGFLIGVHDGRIGVWKGQDPEPFRVIPCPVWVLTSTQQQMLRSGIQIDSMEDVERLLTDFFP